VVAGASVLDAPRHGVAGRPAVHASRRHSAALGTLLLVALVAAVAIVFGAIPGRLAVQSFAAQARILPYAPTPSHPVYEAIRWSFGPFLAVLVGSTVLALLRHRVAAIGIFVLLALTPLVQSAARVLPADTGPFFRLGPNPLGAFWSGFNTRPQLALLWRAFAVDYGLALLPAIAIAAWTLPNDASSLGTRRLTDAVARVRRVTPADAVGLASSVFLFWLVLHTWELRETLQSVGASTTGTDVVAFLPFFLLGVVLARGSRWRFLALAGAPVLWSTQWVPGLLVGDHNAPTMNDAHQAFPFVAVVVAGALWRPIASMVDRETTNTWALVVALNVLNLADVLFTSVAVHSGQAVEANPFAAWIGPGVKLAGVGVASALLARFRPRALAWLVVVFAALMAWHLSGLILDSS
jgi:hypothetical protein